MRNKVLSKRVLLVGSLLASGVLLVLAGARPVDGVQPQESYILKGSPLGGVKFEHKLHVARAEGKCVTCHHASKPEKPLKAAQEACTDCHTKPPQAGMTTGLPDAFHKPGAAAGTCIDCHKLQDAQGKKAPIKCMDCHKKDNV
jgi:nitrate/TMAO reductase-like tetraheme cytochrome c subunit